MVPEMAKLEEPRGLFVTASNASMLADLYELTMAAAYFENKIPGEAGF
jgi:nicotinic acid phosphoribosyltransferase